MSIIHISNVPERVPTVNQLLTTDTGLGYNRRDALFYGLKVNADGSKSVECLGRSINPAQLHDRVHLITSLLDHAPVAEADRGKLITTDVPTGAMAFTDAIDGGTY